MIKFLIFDLDGTAIPNRKDGVPSARLIETIKKAQTKIKVSAATGRPISNCRHLLKMLNLIEPCVISGGTEIINPRSEKVIWKKELSTNQVREIIALVTDFNYEIFFSNETLSAPAKEKKITGPEKIIYIMTVAKKDAEIIMAELNKVKNITALRVNSWTVNHYDIHITHKDATKKHALEKLLERNIICLYSGEI